MVWVFLEPMQVFFFLVFVSSVIVEPFPQHNHLILFSPVSCSAGRSSRPQKQLSLYGHGYVYLHPLPISSVHNYCTCYLHRNRCHSFIIIQWLPTGIEILTLAYFKISQASSACFETLFSSTNPCPNTGFSVSRIQFYFSLSSITFVSST